jgi:hypothetical protein
MGLLLFGLSHFIYNIPLNLTTNKICYMKVESRKAGWVIPIVRSVYFFEHFALAR